MEQPLGALIKNVLLIFGSSATGSDLSNGKDSWISKLGSRKNNNIGSSFVRMNT